MKKEDILKKLAEVESTVIIPQDDTGLEIQMVIKAKSRGDKFTAYPAEWVAANPILAIKNNPNLVHHTTAVGDDALLNWIEKTHMRIIVKYLKDIENVSKKTNGQG